eukprot:621708-Pyramimonas_sp.AAC.1
MIGLGPPTKPGGRNRLRFRLSDEFFKSKTKNLSMKQKNAEILFLSAKANPAAGCRFVQVAQLDSVSAEELALVEEFIDAVGNYLSGGGALTLELPALG